jgi:hypothetical protein
MLPLVSTEKSAPKPPVRAMIEGVDCVGRAHLLRELEALGVDVGDDDLGGAGDYGSEDGAEANPACAEDHNAAPGLYLEGVDDAAGTGLDATAHRAEDAQQLVGGVVVDLDDVAGERDGVLGEGRLAEEVSGDLVVVVGGVDRAGSVCAHTGLVECTGVVAVGRAALEAVAALATGREGQQHLVAGLEVVDVLADLFDDAGALVTEDLGHLGDVAHHHVGVADAGGDHLDQDFSRPWVVQNDVLNFEGAAGFVDDSCSHVDHVCNSLGSLCDAGIKLILDVLASRLLWVQRKRVARKL